MFQTYCSPCASLALSLSYMVDAADPEKIEASKNELHNLLDKPQLQGIPVSMEEGDMSEGIIKVLGIRSSP